MAIGFQRTLLFEMKSRRHGFSNLLGVAFLLILDLTRASVASWTQCSLSCEASADKLTAITSFASANDSSPG